jgi:aldehyde dehydrogenase (NAD+)
MAEHRMLIDGELVQAADGRAYDNINPATEEVAGTAPDAGPDDVERAIGAARRAFDEARWATDPDFRRACLLQLQEQLRKHIEDLRPALTTESGMPIALAYEIGVDGPIDNLSYYPDLMRSYAWGRELQPKQIMGSLARRIVRKEPVGVVAAITPWNFPFQLNLTKIGAALSAGNTVVLKPAPETPWSGTLLAAAAAATDLPGGVLNIITTSDNSVAEILTTHPEVDHVTFTGSTQTGRLIMRNAAATIKRVSLELGGKSAAVILDDADLATSVGIAAGTVCMHGGQGCALPTRLLVPRSRLQEAAEVAAAAASMIPYGDPLDMSNVMGPLISRRQYDRVLAHIETGKTEARLIAGGGPATQFDRGYYVQPTVFSDVPNDAVIAREEIFGPVVVLVPYDGGDDGAVAVANASPYGLSGAVYSGDNDRGMRVAERLRTGTVAVNGAQWFDPESPFGGYKQSGLGREWGIEGLEDFLETKTISYPA